MNAKEYLISKDLKGVANHTVIAGLVDDFAKQKAIEFANWIDLEEFEHIHSNTNEQLYEQFLIEKP